MFELVARINMGEKISIKVKVAEEVIPLRVDMEDEFIYRKAGKRLTSIYRQWANKYPDKSEKELWMLAAYAIMVENAQLHCKQTDSELTLTVKRLNEEIHKILNDSDE